MVDLGVRQQSSPLRFRVLRAIIVLGCTGLIVAIAFLLMPKATANVNQGKRTAQDIASIYASALAAGAFEPDEKVNLDTLVRRLQEGVHVTTFVECTFQIPKLSDEKAREAKRYLRINENGTLVYSHERRDGY